MPQQIKLYLVAILCCTATLTLQAQLDVPRKSISIGGDQNNELPDRFKVSLEKSSKGISSGSLSIPSRVTLSRPEDAAKKKEVRFAQGNDFAKKEYTALENRMNSKFSKNDGETKPEYLSNQYLGDFKSGSKFVKFVYRDHQYVDGDRVQVLLNDMVVYSNLLLTGEFQSFYIDLATGFNKIDILALNQGSSGPNTAQFIMYGDQKEVISSNVWNLATGVKATVIIVKD